MNFLEKIKPEWSLRAGLGFMYLYSGIDIFSHPRSWFWAAKPFAGFLGSQDMVITFLRSQAVVELLFAVILLGWFWPRRLVVLAAGLSALQMLGIVILLPIDAVTFRDLGLLGGAFALFLLIQFGDRKVNPESSASGVKKEGGPVVQTFSEFIGEDKK